MSGDTDVTDVQECLPADMRGPGTVITRITAGLSGAGVWRVDAPGCLPVALKVWSHDESLSMFRRSLRVLRRATVAGLAPGILHVDEERRAVVSAFVSGSFPALLGNPATRATTLARVAQTLRRVHALPLDVSAEGAPEPRTLLGDAWGRLIDSGAPLPPYVSETVEHTLTLDIPPRDRPLVLSHNDVNPGNFVVDGDRLLLVDWDHAVPNDPFFDLATVAVFLALDDDASARLLGTYDGVEMCALPARFMYVRQVIATLSGVTFLNLAAARGLSTTILPDSLDRALPLVEFYQRLRTGGVDLGTAEGLSTFGLSLLRASVPQLR